MRVVVHLGRGLEARVSSRLGAIVKGAITNCVGKLQFDAASPPNPLPHRGGGISNLYLLRFYLRTNRKLKK